MIDKLLIAAALVSAQGSQPQERCVTRQQTADLVVVALPYFIDGAGRRCEPHLAPGAFLRSGGREMSQRLRAEAPARMTSAMDAIRAISGEPIPGSATPEMMTTLMDRMISQRFVSSLDEQACRNIDQLLASLAPLPVDNLGRMGSSVFALATAGRDRSNSPSVCPA